MKWCSTCVLPNTRPNLKISDDGKCNACKAHLTKAEINWEARENAFKKVVTHAQSRSEHYDCIIPVSGGKDSTWQTIKCLEYGLKPLAVTWKTPGRTTVGRDNLENLISLGVDHIDYQINPEVEARFMMKTFKRLGSTGIPMHLAIFNIPLTLATRFKIPLIIWGENSAFEYGASDDAHIGSRMDEDWLKTYGVTHGTTVADWVGEDLSNRDLAAYIGPSLSEINQIGINSIFLGYYFEWDPEMTRETASQVGFKRNTDGSRVGYYDYADIDDHFISLHHWLKWYKFGFTRTFDNLSLEIRNHRITRDEAIDIIKELGDETPHDDIRRFSEFSGVETSEVMKIAETFRNNEIWKKAKSGSWYLPDFLIKDWRWV